MQCAKRAATNVSIVDGKLVNDGKDLTPQFAAIESFDVSLDRGEVVFSAKRKDNFDIGLVALDGSEIHWVPEDPADEMGPVWAPRGNKVAYIVHGKAGDTVRTVHIPTATQLSVPFPYATIRALAWDLPAERYFVVLSSPDASERVQSVKYDGQAPRTDVAPEVTLDVGTVPIGGALVLRPATIRYGEKIQLVVWIANPPYQWDDDRGTLMRTKRVACAIMPRAPDDAFWAAVDATPWIDAQHVYVIGGRSSRGTPVKDINGVR
ncbi:MAG: hypothetical protein M3041_15070 [Acidobacteriota bacterium]|nr:hypothetical protein [Acidobacteriota bacterium]